MDSSSINWDNLLKRVRPKFDFSSVAKAYKATEKANSKLKKRKNKSSSTRELIRCLECTRPLVEGKCKKCNETSSLKRKRSIPSHSGRYFDRAEKDSKQESHESLSEVKKLRIFDGVESIDEREKSKQKKKKHKKKKKKRERYI